VSRVGVIKLRSSANLVRDNSQPTMKVAAAIEKQNIYHRSAMTGTGCDSSQKIIRYLYFLLISTSVDEMVEVAGFVETVFRPR
jgi:hypothetical protein